MGRPARVVAGGLVYHVLNRANGGIDLFRHDGDFAAFEDIVAEACGRIPMRLLDYSLMPTHWHFVLWPPGDGHLSDFVKWITLTHTQRWHVYRENVGSGHIYQGRFKSFIVEEDEHFLTVCRYVVRNPLRKGLVQRAEDWRWSSLWRRLHPGASTGPPLADWPVPMPYDLRGWVNVPLSDGELAALRNSVRRGTPFGARTWAQGIADQFGLALERSRRGRPRGRRP